MIAQPDGGAADTPPISTDDAASARSGDISMNTAASVSSDAATSKPRPAAASIDLDTQLIDPWSEAEECSLDAPSLDCVPGLERFKQLIREDYYLAEAIWAGVFCSLGVGVGMQLVRAVIAAPASAPMPEVDWIATGYIMTPPAAAAAAAAADQLSTFGGGF